MKKDDPYVTESSLRRILSESFAEFHKVISQEIIDSHERLYRRISDEFSEVLSDFAAHVDARFNKVEERLDKIENQLATMSITNQARDIHITRHERWHYLTAKKLQIMLPQDI